MNRPRQYKPRPDKHTVVSGEDADKECPTIGGFTMVECEDCGVKFAVHCLKCNQQQTNCACTIDQMTARHAAENQELAERQAWEKERG